MPKDPRDQAVTTRAHQLLWHLPRTEAGAEGVAGVMHHHLEGEVVGAAEAEAGGVRSQCYSVGVQEEGVQAEGVQAEGQVFQAVAAEEAQRADQREVVEAGAEVVQLV